MLTLVVSIVFLLYSARYCVAKESRYGRNILILLRREMRGDAVSGGLWGAGLAVGLLFLATLENTVWSGICNDIWGLCGLILLPSTGMFWGRVYALHKFDEQVEYNTAVEDVKLGYRDRAPASPDVTPARLQSPMTPTYMLPAPGQTIASEFDYSPARFQKSAQKL